MAKQSRADKPGRGVRGLQLQSGEEVVLVARPSRAATLPRYLYTLGLYGSWRKRQTNVVTNRRILIGRGIFARSERSIPFARVDDASYRRRGTVAYCDVVFTTRGQPRIQHVGPLSARVAKRFAQEVQART